LVRTRSGGAYVHASLLLGDGCRKDAAGLHDHSGHQLPEQPRPKLCHPEDWLDATRLAPVPHRQVVLTISIRLRTYCFYRRRLLVTNSGFRPDGTCV